MEQSRFQFLNPYLKEISFIENIDFDPDSNKQGIQNSFQVQVKKNDSVNWANVTLQLEINPDNCRAPFQLRAKVSSDFKWEEMDEATVDRMLQYNAPALLLGYLRPIVANITNWSRFPTYNLPFINFKGD